MPTNPHGPNALGAALAPPQSETAFQHGAPASPGLIFAKRKRTPFRGPMLNTGVNGIRRRSDPNGTSSRTGSTSGQPAGEAPIQEEDEDEVEEVDYFSPMAGPGEFVTEDQFIEK